MVIGSGYGDYHRVLAHSVGLPNPRLAQGPSYCSFLPSNMGVFSRTPSKAVTFASATGEVSHEKESVQGYKLGDDMFWDCLEVRATNTLTLCAEC